MDTQKKNVPEHTTPGSVEGNPNGTHPNGGPSTSNYI